MAKLGAAAKPAARALCLAATDDNVAIREAALEALEKVQPALAKLVTALVVDPHCSTNYELGIANMGDVASPAIPVLIWHAKQKPDFGRQGTDYAADVTALAKIGPTDPEAVRAIIDHAQSPVAWTYRPDDFYEELAALTAFGELAQNRGRLRQDIVACLVKVLARVADPKDASRHAGFGSNNQPLFAGLQSIVKYGPDAKEAIPLLKKLKFDEDFTVREAAGAALERIEKQ